MAMTACRAAGSLVAACITGLVQKSAELEENDKAGVTTERKKSSPRNSLLRELGKVDRGTKADGRTLSSSFQEKLPGGLWGLRSVTASIKGMVWRWLHEGAQRGRISEAERFERGTLYSESHIRVPIPSTNSTALLTAQAHGTTFVTFHLAAPSKLSVIEHGLYAMWHTLDV